MIRYVIAERIQTRLHMVNVSDKHCRICGSELITCDRDMLHVAQSSGMLFGKLKHVL